MKKLTPVPLTIQDIDNTLKALEGAKRRGAYKNIEETVVDALIIKLSAFIIAHQKPGEK